MLSDYKDILELTDKEPLWYDQNGVPRFSPFDPDLCPNIYADHVFLIYIQCQGCGRGFDVEVHYGPRDWRPEHPKHIHYGDPPPHDCIGDTMNCMDIQIIEAWRRVPIQRTIESLGDERWERVPEFEIDMPDKGWENMSYEEYVQG